MLLPVLNFIAFLSVIHQLEDLKVELYWQRVRLFDQLAAKISHGICLGGQGGARPEQEQAQEQVEASVVSLCEWLFTQIFSKLFL